ncbi:MAG TPA: dihydrolipoyl dehydrogenase [Candidatus Thermoplasmatota archaeon]|nr:dihydrolipoyl dehydrogenase [Candidatus Thermoplasmatota archaeon]
MKETELLVIGAGPGGYVAAIRAAQLGRKVLVVEKENLGGVCLNVGCIPSKALIHAAKTYKHTKEADTMGISVSGVAIDFKKTQAWKGQVVKGLTNGIGSLFKTNGVEHVLGTATFSGANTVDVKKSDGTTEQIKFKFCVIATGSRPIQIPGFTFDGANVIDSTGALALDHVPKRMTVIGGGFIGLEIGNAYAMMGSEVTVVEMMDQILPGTDPEIVRVVARTVKKNGVTAVTGAKAKGLEKGKDGGLEVVIEVKGAEQRIPADKVLVAVGRRPNTDTLGLEKAGVKIGDRGLIPINQFAQTNVPHIYAIGDIVPGPALAHKASKEGIVAVHHLSGDKGAALDYQALPWAIFVDPEVATVGMTEEQAKAKGHEVATARFPFAAVGRAQSTNEGDGFVKMVVDKKTDLVLGVHIVGPDASNLIAEAALAIEMGATAMDLAETIHTHPTLPEALMEGAEMVHKKAIHAVNR